jgi:hypothetical protein
LGGATRGARGQESHGGEMIMLGERAEPGGQTTLGRSAQAGRPYRAYSPGTHARKDEDGLLLEFPCNPTRTCTV